MFGYVRPVVHAGSAAGPVMLSWGYTTSDALRDAPAPEASVTVTLTVKVPVVVGVPETTPLLVFNERPPGSPVADHVNGVVPPFAASVDE